ncbi:hypothetical protein [Janthinobacterium sp. HLS12-2]|uniref:hypothetical protein n=1 Tax=Janthinobacterium sp. HLS12-2 TaxID=1259324 RepID=UPI003F252DA0
MTLSVWPADQLATGCVEVFGARIDGVSTINDRKPCMTNKKPSASKSMPARQPTKLDAATLSNMAHQPQSSGVVPHDDALQRIADMLAKLSPSNVDLVTNIIHLIFEQQTPEK